MASNLNKCIFTGNLTRDVELREAKSGTAVARLTIASNAYAGKDKDDRVNFFDLVAFGRRAEVIAEHFKKGTPILVECQASLNQWENTDGEKRSKIEFIIDSFEFMSRGDGGGGKATQKKKAAKPSENEDDDQLF
jgi:single-strand DNA-binding protein